MGLGRHARFQGHLDRRQDRLLVVMQNEGQDIDHLAITAGLARTMWSCNCLNALGSSANGAFAMGLGPVAAPWLIRRAPGLR